MTVQLIVALIYSAIIFPIFLTVKVSLISEKKCAYFGIFAFRMLRIVDGFAGIEYGKIYYVINGKREVVRLTLLKNMKTKVKPLMDYHILSLNNVLELGDEQLITPYVVGQAINVIASSVFFSVLIKKPYLKLTNDIIINDVITDKKKYVNDFLSFTVVLNILMILISIVKIITEKLINAIKKRKSGKFGSRNFA